MPREINPSRDAFTEWGKKYGEDLAANEEYLKGTSDNPKSGPSKEGYIKVEDLGGSALSPEDELIVREEEEEKEEEEEEDAGYEEMREGEDVLDVKPVVPVNGENKGMSPNDKILEVDEFVPNVVGGTSVAVSGRKVRSTKDRIAEEYTELSRKAGHRGKGKPKNKEARHGSR